MILHELFKTTSWGTASLSSTQSFLFWQDIVEIPIANEGPWNAFTKLELISQNFNYWQNRETHRCLQTTNPYNLIESLHHLFARKIHSPLLKWLPFSIKELDHQLYLTLVHNDNPHSLRYYGSYQSYPFSQGLEGTSLSRHYQFLNNSTPTPSLHKL